MEKTCETELLADGFGKCVVVIRHVEHVGHRGEDAGVNSVEGLRDAESGVVLRK